MQKAIIVDIDGTLAKMNGRGPFDWHRVGEDIINTPVARLSNILYNSGYKIIVFSGRDSCCRDTTLQWLTDNGIMFHELYMRPIKDNRKDSVVKRELYDNNVLGKYSVEFVLDDRDQVVEMWRKDLGVTCLQVDYGNF